MDAAVGVLAKAGDAVVAARSVRVRRKPVMTGRPSVPFSSRSMPATVADDARLLERVGHNRNRVTSNADQLRERFLG
jgi:hypothetical protein